MHEVTAHDAARNFGDLITRAKEDPVIITRYGRMAAVLLSGSQFRLYAELLKQAARRDLFEAVAAAETACAKDEDRAVRMVIKRLRALRHR
ncbi:type II toxin-antitoxin system prevent-host-death family antitoxin [Marinicaulis aureus]|uniref:Antitoxin n=1 Tax=Hyphococcus aureus TaxID=2666033 RepID=A0ABW1L172_9PROT